MFESPLPVGCFWLLGQGTVDAVRYEAAAYASLLETARETVPPFAENIYMAEFRTGCSLFILRVVFCFTESRMGAILQEMRSFLNSAAAFCST